MKKSIEKLLDIIHLYNHLLDNLILSNNKIEKIQNQNLNFLFQTNLIFSL